MAQKLQFFVAGLGRFGKSVAVTLEKMGYDVMAMDIDENVVQDLSDTLGYVVCADCSDEKNLAAIGAGNADVAVVSVGELSASLMTTLILKEMGVKKIVVKALDVRKKYNITVVAIKRKGEMYVNPHPEMQMAADDMLVILGDSESVRRVTASLEQ